MGFICRIYIKQQVWYRKNCLACFVLDCFYPDPDQSKLILKNIAFIIFANVPNLMNRTAFITQNNGHSVHTLADSSCASNSSLVIQMRMPLPPPPRTACRYPFASSSQLRYKVGQCFPTCIRFNGLIINPDKKPA